LTEPAFSREEILGYFDNHDFVEITFLKSSDGSQRKMRCTRKPEVISSYVSISETINLSNPENQIRVFSVDDRGWRSFLIQNLLTIWGD
jgi:hypothetical protein